MLSRSCLVGLSFIRVSKSLSRNSPGEVFTRARIKFDESMRSCVSCNIIIIIIIVIIVIDIIIIIIC